MKDWYGVDCNALFTILHLVLGDEILQFQHWPLRLSFLLSGTIM